MEIIREIRKMEERMQQVRRGGRKIGFVPTMGYLHEGHLSLIREARRKCDTVVMSIFVNPTQFVAGEDYDRYPRDLERDRKLAEDTGVDFIFAPSAEKMYPEGYQTFVEVEKLTRGLCSASRPGHFRGVTTVMTKLFNIVRPDIAYFGQKDAQQAVVIKKMVSDLNMGIEVKVLPIVREKDGLAVSSRNSYLSPEERTAATVLYRALQKAEGLISSGEKRAKTITNEIENLINEEKLVRIDYVAIVSADKLESLKRLEGKVMIALAVFIGKTRLIDNIIVKL